MGRGGATASQASGAATGLAGLGGQALSDEQKQYMQMAQAQRGSQDFYQNQMQNGLPQYRAMTDYNKGNIAQAFAPQYGQVMRQTGAYSNQPSGYRDALMNNLRAQQGRAFDSSLNQAMMANQMAKQQGAAGLQGSQQIAGGQALGYGSMGAGANQSVLYGPQQTGLMGGIGGVLQQGLTSAGQLASKYPGA
jgi:hypothetical protein